MSDSQTPKKGRPRKADKDLSAAGFRKRESRAKMSATRTETDAIASRIKSADDYIPRGSMNEEEYLWNMAVEAAKKDNKSAERIQ